MIKKILNIIGTRPQFIKVAPVLNLLRNNNKYNGILLNTGQHYDSNLSQIFLDELLVQDLKYNLNIHHERHGKQTGETIAAIEDILINEKPDLVLVYGDTNSTLAGALAAAKLKIPIAHVEAGLRSYNRSMPEEINRVIVDQLSELLLVPTQQAILNLQREGFKQNCIHYVGDIMYDAALHFGKKAEDLSQVHKKLNLKSKEYILATIHRAENTDNEERLNSIFSSFISMADNYNIVMPLHPRTLKMLQNYGLYDQAINALKIIDPVGFLDMIMLEKNASVIVTDSGGVQKEAFFYHVPCITLRDETEWVELVELGWNRIVPPSNPAEIIFAIKNAINTKGCLISQPYGDGNAAQRIVDLL